MLKHICFQYEHAILHKSFKNCKNEKNGFFVYVTVSVGAVGRAFASYAENGRLILVYKRRKL